MIPALILAGGQATRLGGVDKASLTLGGTTIIAHLLARLVKQAGPVAISANGDPSRYAHLGLPVVPDELPGRGPLAGVLRGLDWAASLDAEALLTVPADTPFIPPGLVDRLLPAPSWADSPTGLHPLVALWPISAAKVLRDWLGGTPSGRVRAFGDAIGMRAVWFADAPDPFHNINTPADLEMARARA